MHYFTKLEKVYSILRNNGYEEILNNYNIKDGDFSNLNSFYKLLNNESLDNLTNEQKEVIKDIKAFIVGHITSKPKP